MSRILLIILISGVIMSGLISKLFAMSNGSDTSIEFKNREIVFSGSKLQFAMPENFSPDFPADSLVDRVDQNNEALFKTSNKVLLLRRWWDFTEQSFLSHKEMGTIMLSIYINKSAKDYKNRLELIDDIHDNLSDLYKESNKTTEPDFQIAYPETYESFNEVMFNGQRWLTYPVAPMNATEATVTFVSPITTQNYIEIAFTLMPSSKIDTREFEDKYSREFVNSIMSSVVLKYEDDAIKNKLGFDINAIDISELLLIEKK